MASALLHMNLAQINNDVVIGMETGQVYTRDSFISSFSSEMGQLKRDHTEELYKCQVKKRRKQSKPIRIASTESLPDDSDGGKGGLVNKSSDVVLGYKQYAQNDEKSYKNESDEDGSSGENGNDSLLSDSDVKRESPFPLNLSHTKSPPPKDITGEPLSTASSDERNWYKAPTSVPTSIYPIPSFDLASIKSQVYPYNFLLPSQNPGPVPPNFKRIYVGNNENQVASPHRIFNPEAFCDLCNKEFCNKYFLKTHKANKHGIYTDIAATNSLENVPSLPLITYFSNNPANLPLPPTPVSKKSSGSFGSGSSKTNSSSMRAFCNICQREFCNKYFVRRHKAKIHGILENTEDTSQEYKPLIFNEKSDEMGLPGPSSGKLVGDTQQHNNGGKDGDSSFEEDGKVRKAKELENESEIGDSSQNALNFLVSSVQNEEGKESSKSPDRHKKFASNNSAFCDICCKEYCNKYFLRIHKQKCHGIVASEKDEKARDNSGSGVVSSSTWRPDQPMPLNLILRETNQNGNDSDDVNNTCNQCDMTFPESYLLKIHYNLVHNSKFSELKQLSNLNECQNAKMPYSATDHSKNSSDPPPHKGSPDVPNSPFPKNELTEPKYFGSDVQRLHTMIIKLNQHNQQDNFVCDVCSRDFGKSSSLENHIIKDHAALLEEISNVFYEDNQNSQTAMSKWDNSKCQTSFQNSSVMEMSLSDKHSLFDPKMSDRNGEESIDLGAGISMSGERSVVNTPTSSFCEICKKELCNKYFMKTHMQRMHGISIENGAHIGGVVCDICNKELCSKYFLRVHKQNSHGIVEEAFLPQVGNELKGPVPNTDFALKPSDHELSNRYFSHFTEVCSICSRRFRSVKWLRTHLLNDHGDEGKEKWKELQQQSGNKTDKLGASETPKKGENNYCCPSFRNSSTLDMKPNEPSTSYQQNDAVPSMLYKSSSNKSYQCSYCSFTTSVLALLFVHERTHFANSNDAPSELQSLMSLSPKCNEDIPTESTQNRYPPNNFTKEQPMSYGPDFNYQLGPAEKEGAPTNDDNKCAEPRELPASKQGEAGMRCLKCPYTAQKLDMYLEHMQNEHKCENSASYLQIVRDALMYLASTSIIPASFALPSNNGSSNNYIMQPFIVEDKSNSTFVSSVVFLPVKEKLNAPVTAAFSLTPT